MRLAGAGLLLASLLTTGCAYEDVKALRAYDQALEPVRTLINELQRYQPRINERQLPDRIRAFTEQEILTRADRVVILLRSLDPDDPALADLHARLIDIWSDYAHHVRVFVEDLSDWNLESKRERLARALNELSVHWRIWNADAERLHEEIVGW